MKIQQEMRTHTPQSLGLVASLIKNSASRKKDFCLTREAPFGGTLRTCQVFFRGGKHLGLLDSLFFLCFQGGQRHCLCWTPLGFFLCVFLGGQKFFFCWTPFTLFACFRGGKGLSFAGLPFFVFPEGQGTFLCWTSFLFVFFRGAKA